MSALAFIDNWTISFNGKRFEVDLWLKCDRCEKITKYKLKSDLDEVKKKQTGVIGSINDDTFVCNGCIE